jgi:HEAT repeat protein
LSDESVEEPVYTTPKIAANKDTGRGLQDLCPHARGELREILANLSLEDPESLKQGLHRIGQMKNDGAAATPLLRKLLKHDDPFIRVDSALAMARLNLTSDESVAVVTESLKSRNASLRSFGTGVLGEMGPRQNEVLALLAESLKDRDGLIRLRAAEVLIRYDEYSRPALQTLLACLKDKDENVRWLTTYSFAELAPESPEAVQALLNATRDPVVKVRVGAVFAIGEIGPYAKRASDDLRRLLESAKDDDLKSAINHTLSQIN